jgi:hypothetical protein
MKRLSLAAIVLIAGGLVLVGCGGSSGGSSSAEVGTTASSSSGNPTDGQFAISEEARACLKEKGVELPEFKDSEGGGPPAGGEPPEGFEPPQGEGPPPGGEMPEGGGFQANAKAFEECGVELGEFKAPGGKGGPDVNSAAFKKQVNEYVACVRENGYELAEPNFSGKGPIFDKSESESSEFKKASAKCSDLLGGRRGGSGSEATEEG